MSKMTATKRNRILWGFGRTKQGRPRPKVIGYKPAQPRELVTCPNCHDSKWLSVGQTWICHHNNYVRQPQT